MLSGTCCVGNAAAAAFLGTQLLTVGQDGNVAVWNMHSSSNSSSAEGRHDQRMQHPDLNVTMRSWLERPPAAAANNTSSAEMVSAGVQPATLTSNAGAATAAGGAGGVMLAERHGGQADPGKRKLVVPETDDSCITIAV
jgi:hypothetical protein